MRMTKAEVLNLKQIKNIDLRIDEDGDGGGFKLR